MGRPYPGGSVETAFSGRVRPELAPEPRSRQRSLASGDDTHTQCRLKETNRHTEQLAAPRADHSLLRQRRKPVTPRAGKTHLATTTKRPRGPHRRGAAKNPTPDTDREVRARQMVTIAVSHVQQRISVAPAREGSVAKHSCRPRICPRRATKKDA